MKENKLYSCQKVNKRLLILILLTLLRSPLCAQQKELTVPLRKILNEIEQSLQVNFSYADATIDTIFIAPAPKNTTLREKLNYLRNQSGLNYYMLNERYIVVSLPGEKPICGIVADHDTRLPIEGATVFCKQFATATDTHGYFEFKKTTGSQPLHISCVGYKSLDNTPASMAHCDTIFLNQDIKKLSEVVVANYITEGIDINADGAFSINTSSLGILPGLIEPDVLQTVQALPGIQSINETVSDINVRGGTNDQNLILWDGIRMFQSGHFFGLITAFNPYITKKIISIKNGTTTLLDDGVSGTLDIKTDDEIAKNISGGAGINMINADANLNIPLGQRASLQLSSRKSLSDLVKTRTYSQYFNRIFRNTDVISSGVSSNDTLINSNDKFTFYDVSAKLLYHPTHHDKISISFLNLQNKIEYLENEFANSKQQSKKSNLEQTSIAAGIHYRRLWGKNLFTQLDLFSSKYELSSLNNDLKNDQRLIQENEVLNNGIKLFTEYGIFKNTNLLGGYQFDEIGVSNLEDLNNPIYHRYIKKVLKSHAVFGELDYTSLNNQTFVRAGMRLNYIEKFGRFIPEPRLSFNQRFLKNFSLQVLGEMKSQTATQVIDLEQDFLGVEKRRWILANENDVPIVVSKQISGGLRYQQKHLLMSAEAYFKHVDGITSSSQGFQNQFQQIRSTGAYDVRGLEFLINQHLGKLNTWISYALSENQYHFEEFVPSVFPNNLDIRQNATFGSSVNINNLQLSAGVNWHTGKPYTLATGIVDREIIYGEPNAYRLDDYWRVDISAKYHFSISPGVKASLGASVWNLFDRHNIINVYYQINQENNALKSIQQYALGFTPNFSFRLTF